MSANSPKRNAVCFERAGITPLPQPPVGRQADTFPVPFIGEGVWKPVWKPKTAFYFGNGTLAASWRETFVLAVCDDLRIQRGQRAEIRWRCSLSSASASPTTTINHSKSRIVKRSMGYLPMLPVSNKNRPYIPITQSGIVNAKHANSSPDRRL